MKMLKKLLVLFAVAVLPLQAAELNNMEGWYGTAFGGVALSGNAKAKSGGLDFKLKEKTSYAGGVAVGYRFDQMRAEFQVGYTAAEVDELKYQGRDVSAPSFQSHLNSWNFLVNGYYDFNTGWFVEPFVGLGLGVANVDAKIKLTSPSVVETSGSKTTFAYQGVLGARYPLTDSLDLALEYRYVAISKFSIENRNLVNDEIDISYDRHHILASLNIAF